MATIDEQRIFLEQNLFAFARSVLGLTRLTDDLHYPIANWLTNVPQDKRAKLLLLPRDHLKTSLMRAICCHMFIQPVENNLYYPGKDGADLRVLYASETIDLAEKQVEWVQQQFEFNQRLRRLWPSKCWKDASVRKRHKAAWNQQEMRLPRPHDFPEPSLQAIGVGGAVAGRHYDVKIEDDLISLAAANSDVEMNAAIEWHKAAFALMDSPTYGLQYTIGTRWAVYDLYSDMMLNDPDLEWVVRACIEGGKVIVPEWGNGEPAFSLEYFEKLRKRLGGLFFLLYMNSESDASLTDFDMNEVRRYTRRGNEIEFNPDDRDILLQKQLFGAQTVPEEPKNRGKPLKEVLNSRECGAFELRARARVEEYV